MFEARLDVIQESLFANYVDGCFERCGRQHPSPKSGPEVAILDFACDLAGHQNSSHWHAAGNSLCQGNDVGHYPVAPRKKEFAGAPHTSLNLVVDQHCAFLIAQVSQAAIELRVTHPHATHRLNRLKDNSGCIMADHQRDSLEIIKWRLIVTLEQGRYVLPILGQAAGRYGPRSTPVKPSFKRYDASSAGQTARDAHRILIGLGARID